MIYELDGISPQQGVNCFIAANATLVGDVSLGDNVSVWFGAVLRGDVDAIVIGDNSNVQDNSVIHADLGAPTIIGKNVTIGHKVMLHGCTVGDGSLIGINAVVLNGAVIGKSVLIGANALVTENMQIPDGALVLGSPAKVVKILDHASQQKLLKNAESYTGKIPRYLSSLKAIHD